MYQYKCAKCGSGELEPLDDGRKAQCTYCNAVMILPTLDPEAFNRALELRLGKNFDQAEYQFENIVAENPHDSEAYWNLLLCRYGIEYVNDGGDMVPTCHRMSYNSILEDPDYRKALRNADGASSRHYQNEAEKIDSIMQRIRTIAETQPDYDIFISYKETDSQGNRTMDSVIAQSIYDELKEKHSTLNIFLSRVTLKEVAAGLEYEPFIFSALNTAKLMIVVGASRENMESEWVRNEWSRYQRMMLRDRKKHLTVVYKDMEPRDFPDSLKNTRQATLAEGFYLQDFIRGVEGLLELKAKKLDTAAIISSTEVKRAENLVLRGQQEMELENWQGAIGFFQRALDISVEYAPAWWGLFLAETKNLRPLRKEEDLSISAKRAYEMALQYADAEQTLAYKEALRKCLGKGLQEQRRNALRRLRQNTEGFTRFEHFDRDFKALQGLISEENEDDFVKELAQSIVTYRNNYKKYKELETLRNARPLEKMKQEPQYRAMAERYAALGKQADGLQEWSDVTITNILLAAVVLVMTVFFRMNPGSEFWWFTLSWLVPVLVFSTVMMRWFFPFDSGLMLELEVISYSAVPAFGLQFLVPFLMGKLGLITSPEVLAQVSGNLFLIPKIILGALFIGALLVANDHGIIGGILMIAAVILVKEVDSFDYLEQSGLTMDQIKMYFCNPLLILAAVSLFVRIRILVRNRKVREPLERLRKERKEVEGKMNDFLVRYCNDLCKPFKGLIHDEYIENFANELMPKNESMSERINRLLEENNK